MNTEKGHEMFRTQGICQIPTFYFGAFSPSSTQCPGFYPFQTAGSKTQPATCHLIHGKQHNQPLTPNSPTNDDCTCTLYTCTKWPTGSSAAERETKITDKTLIHQQQEKKTSTTSSIQRSHNLPRCPLP